MVTRFVCLANSFKEKGRCLAGIKLDANRNPVLVNGKPKWIRPVSNIGHGEIPTNLVANLNILDIVEIDVTEECPDNYQSENVFFDQASIRSIGKFNKNRLEDLCADERYIFATRYSSLSEEVIAGLSHSLMFIKTDSFEVVRVPNERNPERPKTRLKFTCNDFDYDLPITDPAFLLRHQKNANILSKKEEIYLCLSLGVKFETTNRHYKLVAGIIE